ncbi:hypothetical protein D0Z07_3400 [Hyphodiscus hymeniophilus]|uniref:Uncharacterized protein n=1 Tax=Hyphodiscus hymeniophilus TaxID=353542 RepID=A0A9P6VKW1_9HELO|nr:hypothetical protein D0Z07_3400 [Hyphodiscus hymeniophilus]
MAGNKRKYGQDSSNEIYTNKSRAKPTMEARVDPTYGQRSAIPGLDDADVDGDEEELNYDDKDALSYLRAVRKEATSIPNLLVAPKLPSSGDGRDIYENGIGDFRGWYEDGAYCAAPQESSPTSYGAAEAEEDVGKDPQLAYFDSILLRYETLRAQLHQTPPPEAVARLDKDRPTHLGKSTTAKIRWWKWKMQEVDPVPAQVASMDKETVLKLLQLMKNGNLLKRGAEVQVGISRWAWGLLARLPDRGELTSEEIGVVRELGKKAVLVGMGLKEEQAWEESMNAVEAGFNEDDYEEGDSVVNDDEIDLDIDVGLEESELEPIGSEADTLDNRSNKRQKIGPQLPTDNATRDPIVVSKPDDEDPSSITRGKEEEENESPSEDLAAAKARILAALDHSSAEEALQEVVRLEDDDVIRSKKSAARWNTKATVDMIITVAGEMYGQRDLLEFRQSWGDVEEV